MRYFFCCKALL